MVGTFFSGYAPTNILVISKMMSRLTAEFVVSSKLSAIFGLNELDTQIYLNPVILLAVVGRIGVLAVPQTGNRLYARISNYWVNL